MFANKIFEMTDRFVGMPSTKTPIDSARAFHVLTAASLVLLVICFGLLIFDGRYFGTELTWIKPTKFAASFAVLFYTQALVVERLSDRWRKNIVLVAMAGASGFAMLFEMGYMMYQANLLEASHWNDTSAFYDLMYTLMGVGATALMLSVAVVAAAAVFDKEASISPIVKWGIALGFGLSFVLTFSVAGVMAGNDGRYIGGVPTMGGPTVPLFGWSLEVGDLRPSHFLSLHAMQALPILALGLRGAVAGLPILFAASAGYSALTVALLFQALAGNPLY